MTVHGAIAVVRRGEKLLIAKRPPGKHLAGYWEFPGGRVEAGEKPEETVVRELIEETGLPIRVVSRGEPIDWDYGEKQVHLDVFFCEAADAAEARAIGCDDVRWVEPRELCLYKFPPANAALLQKLTGGG